MMMIKNTILFVAVLLTIGLLLSSVSAQVKVKNNELKNLAGNWDGELEYLDF